MKSARVTMADRSVALASLQAARGEVEGRRAKLMKLRGTPGIRVRRHCMSPYSQLRTFSGLLVGSCSTKALGFVSGTRLMQYLLHTTPSFEHLGIARKKV